MFGFWYIKDQVSGHGDRAALCLSIGYPLFIFLLLALPTTNIARDVFLVTVGAYIWWRRGKVWNEFSGLNVALLVGGLLLVVYGALSGLWSVPPRSNDAAKLWSWGVSVGLFWGASCLYFSKGEYVKIIIFWTVCTGILVNLFGTWLGTGELLSGGRLTGYGVLNNPILLASVAVVQIAIGLHLMMLNMTLRFAVSAGLLFFMAVVALSGSRGPMLAAGGVVLTLFVCFPSWRHAQKLMVAAVACGVGGVILALPGVAEVLTSRGVSYRPTIWQQTLLASPEHLYFGWGWGHDFNLSPVADNLRAMIGESIIHPHGLLISSLYYGGIVGLLLIVLFLGGAMAEALRTERRGLVVGLIVSVLLLTATDTYSVVTNRGYIWLIFWMPMAIVLAERKLCSLRKLV